MDYLPTAESKIDNSFRIHVVCRRDAISPINSDDGLDVRNCKVHLSGGKPLEVGFREHPASLNPIGSLCGDTRPEATRITAVRTIVMELHNHGLHPRGASIFNDLYWTAPLSRHHVKITVAVEVTKGGGSVFCPLFQPRAFSRLQWQESHAVA